MLENSKPKFSEDVLNNYLDKTFYFSLNNEIEQIAMQLSGWKKYLRGIKNEN